LKKNIILYGGEVEQRPEWRHIPGKPEPRAKFAESLNERAIDAEAA
jgi:hypothetical protein